MGSGTVPMVVTRFPQDSHPVPGTTWALSVIINVELFANLIYNDKSYRRVSYCVPSSGTYLHINS